MPFRLASFSPRVIGSRLLIAMLLALVVGLSAATGYFRPAENTLSLAAFDFAERPASGQIHVVEMDAASVEAIRQWPWSRAHYARVVDRLDAAGVRSIGFDVDFSSRSTAQDDLLFEKAIERATATIVLPTFAQSSSYRSGRKLDALPIASLRKHAQLASVSIAPDPDGLIRRMPLGTVTSGVPRPSLSAYFSESGGSADAHFPIDYAIDINTIPRHSFIDIERADFDPEDLRGKDVLIGATAIEMGDRYAIPRYGVTPGVLIQALAAETLLRDTPTYGSWILPLALAIVMATIILGAHSHRVAALAMLGSAAILLGGWYHSYQAWSIWFEVVPALALVLIATGSNMLWIAHHSMLRAQKTDRETGLPNALALQEALSGHEAGHVVAAAIEEVEVLKAVLGAENFALLIARLEERLRASTLHEPIYRTDERVLSWVTELPLCEIEEMLAGLRAIMRAPVEVAGRRVDVTLAFGMASILEDRAIENAAHAASEAHRTGNAWHCYQSDSGQVLEQQVSLMGELDEALANGDLRVFYQPKLHLKTSEVTCAEALVRWKHPVKGMLPPDSFIPLAEETGRVEDLTLFVIRQTITDMREWYSRGLVLGAAVNISARLLSSPSFLTRAEDLLDELGVPDDRLTFEVTESAELDDPDASIAALGRFKARGISISMDDYGTGQSTLSYLKKLPLSELKIDRSFVQYAHIERSDAMLVRSTVQLAHELGLQVVAEGIEDAECLEFLRSINCDYAQGYFIGRPMPASQFADFAQEPARRVA